MSVVIYVESENNKIKKSGFEIASYGKAISENLKKPLIAITFNQKDTSALNDFGVDKVYNISDSSLEKFEVNSFTENIATVIMQENSEIIVLSSSTNARYLGPILAVKIDASYMSNVTSLPKSFNPLIVKRSCFTNKAFNETKSNNSSVVLSLSSNAYGVHEKKSNLEIINFKSVKPIRSLKIDSTDKTTDKVTIADADIVVSGGRGLKGPENWHLIEDLAEVLGAATACSKPVSDMGWRPHSEHVGQTGKPVATNLYIAIGVSGAIQHLAGINSSKIKVVINNDPEAPFFKAADYGIVGDAFEVVPKLIEKLKAIK
jgi:electron transfer flavoprotein alpha subunit